MNFVPLKTKIPHINTIPFIPKLSRNKLWQKKTFGWKVNSEALGVSIWHLLETLCSVLEGCFFKFHWVLDPAALRGSRWSSGWTSINKVVINVRQARLSFNSEQKLVVASQVTDIKNKNKPMANNKNCNISRTRWTLYMVTLNIVEKSYKNYNKVDASKTVFARDPNGSFFSFSIMMATIFSHS